MESQAAKTFKREELFELVWKVPPTKLANQYNIPYNDFRKICMDMQISLPPSGHWSKVRAGKESSTPVLSTNYSGPEEVCLTFDKEDLSPSSNILSPIKVLTPLEQIQREIEAEQGNLLIVPAKLTNPDKLIIAVKERLEKDKVYGNTVYSGTGNISINVSRAGVPRALRFMDTLIKVLKARGHDLKVNYHRTNVVVLGEEIEISLREKLNKTMVKGTYWDSATYSPSGTFIFKMDRIWAKEWKDGKQPLEERISNIVANLELKGKAEKEWRIKREIEAEERRERERIQRELELRQEKELERFKVLLQEAQRWRQVKMLREYITDMKKVAPDNADLSKEHTEWIEWASQKADWYDPQVNLTDELMRNVDKDTLTLRKKSSYYGW